MSTSTDPVLKPSLAETEPFKLPYLVLLGMGGMAMAFGGQGVNVLAMPVYQMTLGINPAWLGIALALPRLWDAITDPLMGDISDNFRSRYGRRRPFVFVGAILMALTFGMIWMVPLSWSEPAQLAWFIVTSILFFTCSTVFSVPCMSLYYEATPDYDERTRVMGASTFWNRVAELAQMWVYPAASLGIFASAMTGVRIVAWSAAVVLIAIPGIITALVGRERFAHVAKRQHRVPFWRSIGSAFSNKAFIILISIIIVTMLAGFVGSTMDYYLLVYFVHGGDLAAGSYWKGILSVAYTVVGFASIPALEWVSRRIGKKRTLIAVLTLYAFGTLLRWFIFRPGVEWLLLVDPLLGSGMLWVAMNMVVNSMFADICDQDELRHGLRREGIFGAAFSWLAKMGVSLAMLVVGLTLSFVGFDEALGGQQPPETILQMRLFMILMPSVTALLSIYVLTQFPIDREQAAETRRILEARRGEPAATD